MKPIVRLLFNLHKDNIHFGVDLDIIPFRIHIESHGIPVNIPDTIKTREEMDNYIQEQAKKIPPPIEHGFSMLGVLIGIGFCSFGFILNINYE